MSRVAETCPEITSQQRSAAIAPCVLVIDDDPMIRNYIAEVLDEEGYDAETVPHGAAALDLLNRLDRQGKPQPDLILLDMRMPVMDGWTFAERYRELSVRHAPIVVVTAAHDADERARQIQADDVLAKPFDLEDLLALVQRYAQPTRGYQSS